MPRNTDTLKLLFCNQLKFLEIIKDHSLLLILLPILTIQTLSIFTVCCRARVCLTPVLVSAFY